MQVKLKRADIYAKAALKAATDTKMDATTRLSIYSPALTGSSTDAASAEFTKARDKLLAQHDLAIDLVRACYAIRGQLAVANTKLGISPLLTQNVQLAAEEARLRALLKAMEADTHVETSAEAVLAKAKAVREQPTDRYIGGREDSVTMAAFTEDDVASVKRQIKRVVDERGGLNETLTALNIQNHIVLDATTIEILRKADILPA